MRGGRLRIPSRGRPHRGQRTEMMRLSRSPDEPGLVSVSPETSTCHRAAWERRGVERGALLAAAAEGRTAGKTRHMLERSSMPEPRCVWFWLKTCFWCLRPPRKNADPGSGGRGRASDAGGARGGACTHSRHSHPVPEAGCSGCFRGVTAGRRARGRRAQPALQQSARGGCRTSRSAGRRSCRLCGQQHFL